MKDGGSDPSATPGIDKVDDADAIDRLLMLAWGKTNAWRGGELTHWLPLTQHLEDTALVAGWLWDEWVPDQVRKRLAEDLGGENAARVLPAGAGMIPSTSRSVTAHRRAPRRRGDDPARRPAWLTQPPCSPQARNTIRDQPPDRRPIFQGNHPPNLSRWPRFRPSLRPHSRASSTPPFQDL